MRSVVIYSTGQIFMIIYSTISQNTHKMGKISNSHTFEILRHPNPGLSRTISNYLGLYQAISDSVQLFRDIFGYLGLSQAVSGDLKLSRSISVYFCLSQSICLSRFIYLGLYPALLDYLGLYQIISDSLGPSPTIFGYLCVSLSLAIFGYLWLSLAISGYPWLPLAISCYLWLSLTISIKYQISGCKQKQERASYSYLKLFRQFFFLHERFLEKPALLKTVKGTISEH